MADLRRFLQSAALAEEQNPFGLARAEQIHDRRGIRRPNSEIDDAESLIVRRRLHRFAFAESFTPEPFDERVHVIAEIGQQDVIAEVVKGHPGISRKPIPCDL